MTEKGLVEKWNNFAKKKIYINDSLSIGCGRFVFSFIIMLIQFFQAYMITGNPNVFWALLLTLITGLKRKKSDGKEEIPTDDPT